QVGMIFQEPMTSLNPVLTVRTQLVEAIRRHWKRGHSTFRPEKLNVPFSLSDAVERAVEALRLVGMPDPAGCLRRYPHQLSGGMQQRAMIAMALACEPTLLIADEPTTALDVTVEAQILDLLRGLQARLGTAILFITHDLAVVAQMAQRVAVMYAGQIVETAPAAALFGADGPGHPYTQLLLRCRPTREQRRRRLESIAGRVPRPSEFPPGCRFANRCPQATDTCRDSEPPLAALADGHHVACHLHAGSSRVCSSAFTRSSEQPPKGRTTNALAEAPLIEARGLTRHFAIRRGILQRVVGHVKAVDGVDLAIPRGRTLALVGESGCGKTTLGKTLIHLIPPTAGTVRFDGANLAALGEEGLRSFRRRAQIVFQDPFSSLDPRMMVREIVEEGMEVHGLGGHGAERRERVEHLLHSVGLSPDAAGAYPHEFSGGQRQRISIARALAVEPDFLVCDEPTSALDVSIQAQILNLLSDLQDEFGLTYLFITHDLGVVEYLADEVAVMYLGRIVEQSPAEPLFDDPLHPYTQALLSAIPDAGVGQASCLPSAGGTPAPRPRARRERIRLSGDVPSPASPPPGCHFHPRCRHAMPLCREVYPGETRLASDRIVRCHLHGS
ncbi:MAG: ABC transporter ATP-binding protein, partial [Planctomycetes bacterium]|nr:ABC transporter ATP-binding protein [Planctomycetota bacterium]